MLTGSYSPGVRSYKAFCSVSVSQVHSYQVSRMLRGSHAILPYQSATKGSTTFLLLPRNHESASQVIRWAWWSRTVQLLTGQMLEREDRKYLWEKKLLPQELNPYLLLVKQVH